MVTLLTSLCNRTTGGTWYNVIMSSEERVLNRATRAKLTGERGLVAAVIGQAVDDALATHGDSHVVDSWAYFNSEAYKSHLACLGLPGDWQPEPLERMTDERIMELSEVLLR